MNAWLQTHFWKRNALIYMAIGLVLALFNGAGLQEVMQTNPAFLVDFWGFYTLTYGLCLFHNRVLFERFFRQRRYGLYALGCGLALAGWWLLNEWLSPLPSNEGANLILAGAIVLLFGWGLYMIAQYVVVTHWQLRAELSSTRAELVHLRAQLNPHFLFNALNNLYGVSVSNPDNVPDYVLQLADLLRYQIESSRRDRVPVADELHFLEQFITYERQKLGHRGRIDWQVEGSPDQQTVAPLLLFQFVENAFKYAGQKGEPVVYVRIELTESQINFVCQNEFDPRQRGKTASTKTGLANARQQLALQYPQRHTLTIQETGSVFSVHLTLQLTNDSPANEPH